MNQTTELTIKDKKPFIWEKVTIRHASNANGDYIDVVAFNPEARRFIESLEAGSHELKGKIQKNKRTGYQEFVINAEDLESYESPDVTDDAGFDLPDCFGGTLNQEPWHTNEKGETLDIWWNIDWASNLNGVQHDKLTNEYGRRHKNAVNEGKLTCLRCEYDAYRYDRDKMGMDYALKGKSGNR